MKSDNNRYSDALFGYGNECLLIAKYFLIIDLIGCLSGIFLNSVFLILASSVFYLISISMVVLMYRSFSRKIKKMSDDYP